MTQEMIRTLFDYDSGTGAITWKIKPIPSIPIGSVAGYRATSGYWIVIINKRRVMGHRIAWLYVHGYIPACIDHIDRNKSNNALSNLREATKQQNMANSKRDSRNKSGCRGVGYLNMKRPLKNRWQAKIHIMGKLRSLGCYPTKEEAEDVYKTEARRIWGDFYFHA